MFSYGGIRRYLLVRLVLQQRYGFCLNCLNITSSHWFATSWYLHWHYCSCGPMLPLLSTSKVLILYFNILIICLLYVSIKLFVLIRSPPRIPEVHIPEEPVLQFASALRTEINQAFAVLRDIASGRDLKKFLSVCQFPYCYNLFCISVLH